jgi:hypothetical protein
MKVQTTGLLFFPGSDRLYVGVPLKFYNALIVFYGNQIAEEYLNRISRLILIFLGGCWMR